MAHFVKLDENNVVVTGVVVNNDAIDSENEEASGIEFLNNLYGTTDNWKQTSYNGNIRKNYAGIGYTYDPIKDAFIAPKPENAIGFDEDTCQWITPKVERET
jgi:hypothetical protein